MYRSEPEHAVSDIVLDPFESPYRPSVNGDSPGAPTTLPVDLKRTVRELEVDLVNRAMAAGKFNQRRAADLLGLTYHQFRGYLKKYDHERAAPSDADPTSGSPP